MKVAIFIRLLGLTLLFFVQWSGKCFQRDYQIYQYIPVVFNNVNACVPRRTHAFTWHASSVVEQFQTEMQDSPINTSPDINVTRHGGRCEPVNQQVTVPACAVPELGHGHPQIQ